MRRDDLPARVTRARTLGGEGDVDFAVSYAAAKSELKPQSVGHVECDRRAWKRSGDVHMKPELASTDDGWPGVAFVLTAGGKTGEIQIDDIDVDPQHPPNSARPPDGCSGPLSKRQRLGPPTPPSAPDID